MTKRKHYVVFYSPGTFIAESSVRPIESWSTETATSVAKSITERHGAIPYGFRFETRVVAGPIPDGEGGTLDVEPKTVERSGMYYLGGVVETIADVEARHDPKESILLSNMRCNGYDRVITTTNGYRLSQPFEPGDHVVDPESGTVTL